VLDELRALQTEAPPMPYEMVAECIDRGLGTPLRDTFAYFDPTPLGAASIGQVHRARLFDGRTVAVKVQYPGIADTLESDVKNFGAMLNMGRVVADKERLDEYLAEITKGLIEEANYENEADNLQRWGELFRARPNIAVPKVIHEHSSRTVLTMELIEGEKLDVALAKIDDPSRRNQLGVDFSHLYIWMFHEENVLHADPHPGNFLLTPEGKIALLDFGCVREYDAEFCDGWLDILVAKWSHDRERLVEVFDRLGFQTKQGARPVDAKQLSDFCEIVCAPFLYDREFDWGAWQPVKPIETFIKGNLAFLRFAAPSRALFYYRVAGGVWGFLQRASIRGNWYRHLRELAERRGRM
jgi:predicted unusual protein kinase regulating ubiquinone biosynthesis (AarF/ABC1/UbiB family)